MARSGTKVLSGTIFLSAPVAISYQRCAAANPDLRLPVRRALQWNEMLGLGRASNRLCRVADARPRTLVLSLEFRLLRCPLDVT